MNRRTLGVTLAAAAMLAAACQASGGSGTGKPQPAASYCIFDCASSPVSPTPKAVIDAVPLNSPQDAPDFEIGDCSVDLTPPGTGLTAGASLVLALAHNYCRVQPWSVTTMVSIQSCRRTVCVDSDWRDEPGSIVIDNRVPPEFPAYNLLHTDTDCVPGVSYRIAIKAWGDKAIYQNGEKVAAGGPFATRDHPFERYGAQETYSKSECTGK